MLSPKVHINNQYTLMNMKKLLIALALAVATVAPAAVYTDQNFLNGWNLYVTNSTAGNAAATVGGTNNLYTYIHGEVYYSLTNNMGNTNAIAPDAFDVPGNVIYADANGDVNANAAIHYYINNTNWIPIVVTNSQGQYFVTNTWALNTSQWPTYMYPATTNYYPSLPNASATNLITFNFQRGWQYGISTSPINVWDTSTNVFQFSVNANGFNPVSGITNLPTSFMQGANLVRLQSVLVATNTTAVSSGLIINQISLGQWVP